MPAIALYTVSVLLVFVALLHFGCLFTGAAGYRFLGAGERIAGLAEKGHWYPHFTAISVGVFLAVVAVYAFVTAGGTTTLPYAYLLLSAAATVFLVRSAVFPLMKNRFKGNSDRFWYISSFCSFILGALLAAGTWF